MKTFIGILLLTGLAMFAIVGTFEKFPTGLYVLGLLFLGMINVLYYLIIRNVKMKQDDKYRWKGGMR